MFEKNLPIYVQLMDAFKVNIVTGAWPMDTYIQSVRELALSYQANPNTVMKALSELEAMGLLVTDRTVGKKVSSDQKLITKTKRDMVNEAVEAFIQQTQKLGMTRESLIESLKENKEQV